VVALVGKPAPRCKPSVSPDFTEIHSSGSALATMYFKFTYSAGQDSRFEILTVNTDRQDFVTFQTSNLLGSTNLLHKISIPCNMYTFNSKQ